MQWLRMGLLAVVAMAPMAVRAELKLAADDGLLVEHRYQVKASPERTWDALMHPEGWWPNDHTWSGSAANLSLQPEAGGCFCERWPQGSAEHGRVVMIRTNQLLRISGALGPLQEMAVVGVLTIQLAASDEGTVVVVSYRVSATPAHQLLALSGVVDEVVRGQFSGLAKVAETSVARP